MNPPWLRIVVVGHVDHGKSTLIGRLLHDSGALPDGRLEEIAGSSHGDAVEWAFLMDHFHEEREQERTIDSTQAFCATPKRICRIIDAPGHKEFLKNMVTGAAQADAAILVVDVEAGVLEQTRRHVAMLAMLGQRRVIMTINKMDSAGGRRESFQAVADAARSLLRQLNIAAHAVIPISARYGWNLATRAGEIAWYDGPTLFEALDSLALPEPLSQLPLRFPVQDICDFNGRRRLVGRIESGRMAQGQTVLCLPSGRTARIASVERFLEDRTSAEAGESIGVTLDEPTESQAGSLCHQVRRGEVFCNPETPASVVRRIEANLFWLADRGWARGDALSLRCTTQEVPCRIESVRRRINSSTFETMESNAARLEATEVGHVVIAVQQPLVVDEFAAGEPLGRFVLLKDDELSAGGTVTRAIS